MNARETGDAYAVGGFVTVGLARGNRARTRVVIMQRRSGRRLCQRRRNQLKRDEVRDGILKRVVVVKAHTGRQEVGLQSPCAGRRIRTGGGCHRYGAGLSLRYGSDYGNVFQSTRVGPKKATDDDEVKCIAQVKPRVVVRTNVSRGGPEHKAEIRGARKVCG